MMWCMYNMCAYSCVAKINKTLSCKPLTQLPIKAHAHIVLLIQTVHFWMMQVCMNWSYHKNVHCMRSESAPHLHCICNLASSLVPRPHPPQGKRVWGLASIFLVVHRQQSSFQINQSDHSFRTATWLANHRDVSAPLLLVQVWIAHTPYWPIRSKVWFTSAVSVHISRDGQSKQAFTSPQTLSLLKVGSGNKTTWPAGQITCKCHNEHESAGKKATKPRTQDSQRKLFCLR